MSDDVIDLNAERSKREQPDQEFVRQDEYGRPLYHFGLQYEMDGSVWSTAVWAYDFEDADKRCAAMRESLKVLGKTYSHIPV